MARKVLVRLVDDLDGLPSEDVATVTFSLDRVSYQIDLNQANAARLREGLAQFVQAARRTGGRARRGTAARAAGNDGPAIREWARENGHELAERGRIPSHVVAEYRAATKGGRAKSDTVTATVRPARVAKPVAKTPAKTAAASRSAKSTTAKAPQKKTAAARTTAARTTAAKTAAARTTPATTAKAAKTAKAAQPKAAKAPRSAASTAGGQRGRRATRSR
jgi:hypothetical protein